MDAPHPLHAKNFITLCCQVVPVVCTVVVSNCSAAPACIKTVTILHLSWLDVSPWLHVSPYLESWADAS